MSYGDGSNAEDVREALSRFRKTELKTVVKEAIKEWLDEQALTVGRWSIRFFFLASLGALTYFILTQQGWHK